MTATASEHEPALPERALATAVMSGNERAWRPRDAVVAVQAAAGAGLGCLGGEVQFVISAGTCELYWRGLDNGAPVTGEEWERYVARSAAAATGWIAQLLSSEELLIDARRSFADIRALEKQGGEPLAHLVFVLYFIEERRPEDPR
jgi:hypothetical protein